MSENFKEFEKIKKNSREFKRVQYNSGEFTAFEGIQQISQNWKAFIKIQEKL